MVSGLPLLTKPLRTRLRLINDAFALMRPDAPFVQFTYSMTTPPIPEGLSRVETEASERIWMNLPPARVWVYRKALNRRREAMACRVAGTAAWPIPQILVFAGSIRTGSFNARLAALAAQGTGARRRRRDAHLAVGLSDADL